MSQRFTDKGGFTSRSSDLRTLRWVDRWYKNHPGGRLSLPTAIVVFLLVTFEICLVGTKDCGLRFGP